MWDFFLKQNRFTYLLILSLIALGVYSAIVIPKESAPAVEIPVAIITTVLPGASASDVERLVTNELERGLAGTLENVNEISSVSSAGVSMITVEFAAEANLEESIQDLKDRLDTVKTELPSAAEEPTVTEVNFVDQPILNIAISGDLTASEFSVLAKQLTDELEKITGVSRVEVSGVQDNELTVMVSEEALVRHNLSINDIVNGIRAANTSFPIGEIVTNNISYNIVFESSLSTQEAILEIPIAVRGGQPIYVYDVATVSAGLAKATSLSRVSINGAPSESAITVNVFKQSGGDITRVTDAVNERVAELAADGQLLAGLATHVVYDAGEQVASDLTNLLNSGIITVTLVILALILTIGWREGLLAGLAIPLSFTIGFIGLYFSDNTLNFISLFALILGIGILVDSGIVMVEGINKIIRQNPNLSRFKAAHQAVAMYGTPLISGTLTTIAMFVGLFVVSGVTGQFIAGIPFTLIAILLASIFVALAILPLLSSKLLKTNTSNLEARQHQVMTGLENWYRSLLNKVVGNRSLERRFLLIIVAGFFSALSLIPFGFVKVVFFEQSDMPMIFIDVELAEGSRKETTDIAVRQVEEVLYPRTDMIEAYTVTVGAGNAFTGGGQNERLASFTINLHDPRPLTSTEFIAELRTLLPRIPGANITISEPNSGPPVGNPIAVNLYGDDLDTLSAAANTVVALLEANTAVINVTTSAAANNTEFLFALNEAEAILLGLDAGTVSQSLRAAVFGVEATTITTLTDDVPVKVRLDLTDTGVAQLETINHTDLNGLESILLPSRTGQAVPLGTVVETSLREANNTIRHEDLKRVVTVSADLAPGGNVIEINEELTAKLDEQNTLPPGVTFSLGGEAEESNQAFLELFLALVVGIVLMVAVLVLQFNSFRYTLYVLSILPFSLIGILYGLAITGSSLSFPSIMGFIALTGIIVNNSILLIDLMNARRRQQPEMSVSAVVVDASVHRLRAILLTSLTTIIGMIPLLASDPIWVPLATAIIFGLSFSVVITLFLVPIIYHRWPGVIDKTKS